MIITGNAADVADAYIKARQAIQTIMVKDADSVHKQKYVSLPAILKEITPTLISHGLTLMQEPITNDLGIGVATVLLHTSGGTIEFMPLTIPFGDAKPQTLGSALSYARRYAVMSIFGLAGDDDDGQAAQDSFKAKAAPASLDDNPWDTPASHTKKPDTLSPSQLQRIHILGKQVHGDAWQEVGPHRVKEVSKGAITSSKQLTVANAEILLRELEEELKAKPAANGVHA